MWTQQQHSLQYTTQSYKPTIYNKLNSINRDRRVEYFWTAGVVNVWNIEEKLTIIEY